MTLARPRKPLKVYQDAPETTLHPPSGILTRSASKSSIPLAARTRSMTRLSSAASANTSRTKLGRIDKLTGKLADKENSANTRQTAGKRSFGDKMLNLQTTAQAQSDRGTDGLKRKAALEAGNGNKRFKREGDDTLRSLPVNQSIPVCPTTPVKTRVELGKVQPTPARLILGAKQGNLEGDEEEEEDETSPGVTSRFIARPPTPPRPHMSFRAAPKTQSPPRDTMDIDSPERPQASTTPPITPTRSIHHATSDTPLAPPVTPRSTAITPKRVLGSISRFRTGTTSVRKPTLTPLKSPEVSKPMLASLLGASREDSPVTDSVDTVPLGRLVEEHLSTQSSLNEMKSFAELPKQSALQPVEEYSSTQKDEPIAEVKQTPVEADQPMAMPGVPHINTSSEAPLMPPPSRIPRTQAGPTTRPRGVAVQPSDRPMRSSIPVRSRSAYPTNGLGRGLPSTAPTNPTGPSSASTTDSGAPTRRKPSYPSSLGSGPLPRPRDRMVSGPTLYAQQDGTLGTKKEEPHGRKPGSPRSVSEPTQRPRPSLSASTSRREGLSLETSKSLAGLADALKTLRMRKPDEPRTGESSKDMPSRPSQQSSLPSVEVPSSTMLPPTITVSAPMVSTSSRLSSIHRPRNSVLPAPSSGDESMSSDDGEQAGDKSLAAILSSTCGEGCLKGVVAFVDVKTADGDDASMIFSDMLRSLGAKVLSRLTENVTHIIYKSGKPTTLAWYRKQDEDERPHIVGISWVTRSKEKGERLDEQPFAVKVADEDIFQKRRKSMEPKALMQSALPINTALSIASVRRQSMMYAPKISSPLKKTFRGLGEDYD